MTTPSVTELAGRTAADVVGLVQAELQLVRTELREEVRRTTKAGVGLLLAAVVALLAVAVLTLAGCWALALVLPTGAAFGIVGGALLLLSAPLLGYAIRKLRQSTPPMTETKKSLDEVASWTLALRR